MPPQQRAAQGEAAAARATRQIRSLLNKLGEGNVTGLVTETLALTEDVGRHEVMAGVSEEILRTAEDGSRASERLPVAQVSPAPRSPAHSHSAQLRFPRPVACASEGLPLS